jgi:Glycosyltransferase family 17
MTLDAGFFSNHLKKHSILILIATLAIVHARRKFSNTSSAIDDIGGRDGNLISLAALLNRQYDLFRNWKGTEDNYVNFIDTLLPWILSPPPLNESQVLPLTVYPKTTLNCKEPKYAGVLTGEKRNSPREIVDFIPFGYDVDKLELRFHEYYDVVSAFVIYESPRTERSSL